MSYAITLKRIPRNIFEAEVRKRMIAMREKELEKEAEPHGEQSGHVSARYDSMMESTIQASVIMVNALPSDVKFIDVQLGGNVGPVPFQSPSRQDLCSVHIWTVE